MAVQPSAFLGAGLGAAVQPPVFLGVGPSKPVQNPAFLGSEHKQAGTVRGLSQARA